MSSPFRKALITLALLLPAGAGADELRVCADANNLPYSNEAGEGFENRIAAVVADEMNRDLTYVWWAQRRGIIGSALNEGLCDVLIGTGTIEGVLLTYPPYYRSIYTAVSGPGGPAITSFDDPRLTELTIGVELVGGDGAMSLPAAALAARGLIDNVRGYTVTGDYSQPHPLSSIVDAVAAGDVDVAFVWGPVAGYFAALEDPPPTVRPLAAQYDGADRPLAFDISMAVRFDEGALRLELERAIASRRDEIDQILADYRVPRLDHPASAL